MEKEKGNEFPKTQHISVPTTFVQADRSSFMEVVQKLTGISEETQEKLPITMTARQSSRGGGKPQQAQAEGGVDVGPRKSAFKLHERRQSMRKLEIQLGLTSLRHSGLSPGSSSSSAAGEIRYPDLPPLVPSPVTPLGSDPFTPRPCEEEEEEERAIAEKGFYLHPSPLHTPRAIHPELLPLFPLHSPKHSTS